MTYATLANSSGINQGDSRGLFGQFFGTKGSEASLTRRLSHLYGKIFKKDFKLAKERTRQSRYYHCFQVRAERLPGGRALSVDLSKQGICLETFSEMTLGQTLQMELDLGPFPVSATGVVAWCEKFSSGIYRIGIDLRKSRPNTLHAIARYLEQQEHEAGGSQP